MKKIIHTDTLVYYDGAQVFEGQDLAGGCYIGVLIDSLDNADHYVVAGVSAERMNRFRAGTLDLRSLFGRRIKRRMVPDTDLQRLCGLIATRRAKRVHFRY